MGVTNYIGKVKNNFAFSKEELRNIILTIFAFAFILSFKEWGYEAPSVVIGLKNFSLALAIVAVSFLIHHSAQKLTALRLGHKAEHKLMWKTLLFCLAVVIISNGSIMLFAASTLALSVLPYHALGRAKKGPDMVHYAISALAGPLSNVLFAALAISLSSSAVANKIFTFNMLFAAYNLLPIPPLDGSHVFYGSRMLYAFAFGFVLAYILLSYLIGFYAVFFAIVSGAVFWLVFYIFFEKEWTSPH